MTIHSRWTTPIPQCSLPQWVFGSANGPLSDVRSLIDPDRPDTHFLTKADFRLLAKRIALGLLDAGLQRGDRVLVFSSNHLYYPSLILGILMAGGVFTGANPSYVPRELVYQLRDSGARFMVTSVDSLNTALEAAQAVGLPRDHIYLLDRYVDTPGGVARTDHPSAGRKLPSHLADLHDWLALVDGNLARAETWAWTEPADPKTTTCCLNYSSGTTGVPKGVEISHHAYVGNCAGVVALLRSGLRPDEPLPRRTALCFLPLYHAYGQAVFVANYPHMDASTYIMPKFDFVKLLQHIERYRVSSLLLVPPVAVALTKHPLTKKYDLSSIENVGCGAAPLAPESAAAVERLWPPERGIRLRQGWGMTEVTCTCMAWTPERTEPNSHAVGELAPNFSARLVEVQDDDDTSSSKPPKYITEANVPGELWVHGPTLLTGYWRNPEATAATLYIDPVDGKRWLRTGDIAFIDKYGPGGLFQIVERRKELIKVKGSQVAPAELEALLLERPDVTDAAVIGVSINGEERPRAYIVRTDGAPAASAEEIAKWMAEHVAPFKRLTGGVIFTDAIPKNPSGKILRKILREQAAKELAAKPTAKL